jgi:hypothetical protein
VSLLLSWKVFWFISLITVMVRFSVENMLNWINPFFLFFQVAIKIIDKTQLNPGSLQKVKLFALEVCFVEQGCDPGNKSTTCSFACISRLKEILSDDVIQFCSCKFI